MTPNATRNAARRHALLLAACLALSAWPAAAEKADRDKPINIEADRVNVDDARQIAVFEGRVMLNQGTLSIRGDRMELRQDGQGFKTGVAWGNLAHFRQKREGFDEYIEGWAERIEYDSRADKVQMFGRASMRRGADEVRGNYISYDATTEFFQVTTAGTPAGGDSRVRAVIQPKPKAKPAPQPPLGLQPAEGLAAPREALPAPRP
jgi:lipopolysaccharide export system protein LptA